jgi:hypothetical protein
MMSLISLAAMFAWVYYAISKTFGAKDDALINRNERIHALEVEIDQLSKEMELMTNTHTRSPERADGFMQAMGFTYREVKREVGLLKDPRLAQLERAIKNDRLFETPYDPEPEDIEQLTADVETLSRQKELFEAIERNLKPELQAEWRKVSVIAKDVARRMEVSARSAEWTLTDPTPD